MKNKIFISYRRDGGEAFAQLLYEKFKRKYEVFYDIASDKAGSYIEEIKRKIESCDCVIVVLSPHSLDRCVTDNKDLVAFEISYANECGKKIIPMFIRGFKRPEGLPESILYLFDQNGVDIKDMEYFDEKIEKIEAIFGTTETAKKTKRLKITRAAYILIASLLVASLIVAGAKHLSVFEEKKYEIESFYIVGETENQYYDELFVFAGETKAPIVNIYISNSDSVEEIERFFVGRVEVKGDHFRFETTGKAWWCKCNEFEIVPCDNDGNELQKLAKTKKILINYPEGYEPLKIIGAPYYISEDEQLLISWKDIYLKDNTTYRLYVIDADAWAKQSWDKHNIHIAEAQISETGWLLKSNLLKAGEYVIVVLGSATGHVSSADYAYLTVTEKE